MSEEHEGHTAQPNAEEQRRSSTRQQRFSTGFIPENAHVLMVSSLTLAPVDKNTSPRPSTRSVRRRSTHHGGTDQPPVMAPVDAGPDIALVREQTRHRLVLVGVAAYASVVPLAVVALLIGKLSAAEVRELFAALNVPSIAMCAATYYFGRASR